mmetsp:Transcript_2491/g.7367  ORF Transcript_2491/g.7367 Transcript_2491/m.7367 type:complete len:284 (+) Transcript_2491:1236-2087(+)
MKTSPAGSTPSEDWKPCVSETKANFNCRRAQDADAANSTEATRRHPSSSTDATETSTSKPGHAASGETSAALAPLNFPPFFAPKPQRFEAAAMVVGLSAAAAFRLFGGASPSERARLRSERDAVAVGRAATWNTMPAGEVTSSSTASAASAASTAATLGTATLETLFIFGPARPLADTWAAKAARQSPCWRVSRGRSTWNLAALSVLSQVRSFPKTPPPFNRTTASTVSNDARETSLARSWSLDLAEPRSKEAPQFAARSSSNLFVVLDPTRRLFDARTNDAL